MHVGATHTGEVRIAANAGLAAFEVAVVQQKRFEETLERVSEKQTEISSDAERHNEETRQRAAEARGGLDIIVRGDVGDAEVSEGAEARGQALNVNV